MRLIPMRRILILGAAALAVPAAAGAAQLDNAIEVCADPQAAPRDVVRFCRMALDSGKLDGLAAAQVNANLGVGYFDLGRYAEAADAYSAAIAGAPDMVAAYVNRGRALERLERPEEAAADYTRAIELDQGAADAWLGRGVLMLRYGQTLRAIEDFNAAIRLEPRWSAPRFNLGIAYLQAGNFGEAAGQFSEVIRQEPDDAAAWINRGRARAGMGDPDAQADFDHAIELAPESGESWLARGRYHDERGAREAANADFLRAYELGLSDPWLMKRVREISG